MRETETSISGRKNSNGKESSCDRDSAWFLRLEIMWTPCGSLSRLESTASRRSPDSILEGHKVTLAAEVKDFDFGDKRAARRLDIADQYALDSCQEKLLQTAGSSAAKTWIRIVSAYTEARVSAASPPWNSEVEKCVKKGNHGQSIRTAGPDDDA